MRAVLTFLAEALFVFVAAPVLLTAELLALWAADLAAAFREPRPPADEPVRSKAVSVVIPTWNGKHHLEANLPSVVAALEGDARHEIIIVENASNDGSAEFLRQSFPQVRVLEPGENLGFGGGSNAGFEAAKNDIVVLLNNDMRVEKGFLAPLVEGFNDEGFTDEKVFAVSAQIFFSDPNKRREETGLTVGEWKEGRLELGHKIDDEIDAPFPTFYAGGGSTAYDRRKFLELGGFDALLHPFYMEDADISYMAWKRGWKVLYAPGSVVYHEHRGTIGKRFSREYIERTIQKNQLLFTWKNIHEPRRLAGHFWWTWASLAARLIAGPAPNRPDPFALLRAIGQTGEACRARIRARRLATTNDAEALKRPWAGYFRDRFAALDASPEKLSVLFVSPYGIEPPIHGGAVFMNQTLRRLTPLVDLHLFCLLDEESEIESNQSLAKLCSSGELMLRRNEGAKSSSNLLPHAAQEFLNPEVAWRLHRSIYRNRVDAVQIEYTQLGVYVFDFRRIGTFLFEHDAYFQSVARAIRQTRSGALRRRYRYEYLRALRFERRILKSFDSVQVCTPVNRRYLESFAWDSAPIYDEFRAGIDLERYELIQDDREADTLLFIGNFKHPPNQAGLDFFIRQVFPVVRRERPQTRLIVVGAQAPAGFEELVSGPGIEFLGAVDDIREPLSRYAVFLAPILSGSGVRVKLLEAFAAGIPVVSTRIGAEGLAEKNGEFVELAEAPEDFAEGVLKLLRDPAAAREMALRARVEVERRWDMAAATRRLAEHYRLVVETKRKRPSTGPIPS